mmetsp:Transcript_4556/g.9431  ORF Transcript_4556/g.9431 Transcript_4556/m.9431 type:complete len:178 (-) Transcript_4556:1068-1601(-)
MEFPSEETGEEYDYSMTLESPIALQDDGGYLDPPPDEFAASGIDGGGEEEGFPLTSPFHSDTPPFASPILGHRRTVSEPATWGGFEGESESFLHGHLVEALERVSPGERETESVDHFFADPYNGDGTSDDAGSISEAQRKQRQRVRADYKCSKCGKLKKGHVCEFAGKGDGRSGHGR